MAGRAQAFSDPTVIALASERFIPVAENCSPLQTQQDAKGAFFRLVAEQGHYQGRTFPTGTRQGYYALTADGTVLAAMNSRDPQRMIEMMQTALRRWSALQEGTSRADGVPSHSIEAVPDYVPARPDRYPEDGLVLQLVARDLPRDVDERKDDWRKAAWNMDYAWFSREEARTLVPGTLAPGATADASQRVLERLARFHLRDFVRGEPSVWPAEAIRHATLTSEVTRVDGDLIHLTLRGQITLAYQMRWIRPDDGETRVSDCAFDASLAGEATWDVVHQRFVRFDLVAAGPRQGTNQYNNRADDLGPAPMGIAFTLAGDEPRHRTPPHLVYHHDYWGAGAAAA